MIVCYRDNILMKIAIWLTFIVCATTATINPPPRSVNVALETSFLFDPKEINQNIAFIKNIRGFLDKLYSMLAPQAESYKRSQERESKKFRTQEHAEKQTKFLDLIEDFCDHIPNVTLLKLIRVAKQEINKIIDSNQQLKHLFPDKNVKNIIDDFYTRLSDKNVIENTQKWCLLVRNDKNPEAHKFLTNIGRIYTQKQLKKLRKYIRKFKKAIHNESDPSYVVKEFIQYGVVKKYNELNDTLKDLLIKEAGVLLQYIETKNKETDQSEHQDKNESSLQNEPSVQSMRAQFDDVIDSKFNFGVETRKSNGEIQNRRSPYRENRIGIARPKNTKRSGKNEIIVDNVELIVQSLKF